MIPFLDLQAQYRSIQHEVDPVVRRVLESGQYVLGPEVVDFEEEFGAFCGTRHCVAVNSGTSALQMALMCVGVQPGDEVITVPMTFVATTAAIRYLGATPRFVDIDPVTLTLDVDQLHEALTEQTKAVVPVHLYGLMADMQPILDFARTHGLAVVEDAAQAHGAEYRGRRAGAMAELGCFSFYPGKNLGACGEGGAVVTNSETFAEQLRALRDWGQQGRHRYRFKGFNYRMDALQAAILRVKLGRLNDWTAARRRVASRFSDRLRDLGLVLPYEPRDRRGVFHVYGIRLERRDALRAALSERGVDAGVHYPVPIHLTEAHADLGYGPGDFPISEGVAATELSLPIYPELTVQQIDEICSAVIDALHAIE